MTDDDLQSKAFKLRSEAEYQKIKHNEKKSNSQFEKYVSDYILQAKLEKVPNLQRFGYTTLVNYHDALLNIGEWKNEQKLSVFNSNKFTEQYWVRCGWKKQ